MSFLGVNLGGDNSVFNNPTGTGASGSVSSIYNDVTQTNGGQRSNTVSDAASGYESGVINTLTGGHASDILSYFAPPDKPAPQTPGAPPDMNQIRQAQLDQQLADEKNQASSNPVQTTGAGLMGGPPMTSRVLLTGKAA